MTTVPTAGDEERLVAALREACNGHPHAKIAWPHRILHEAADLITRLRQERDEARANAWPFGKRPNPVVGHTSGDFAVYGDEKSVKRASRALHELDAMMPARIERIQQEQAGRAAAEAALTASNAEAERLRAALRAIAAETVRDHLGDSWVSPAAQVARRALQGSAKQ